MYSHSKFSFVDTFHVDTPHCAGKKTRNCYHTVLAGLGSNSSHTSSNTSSNYILKHTSSDTSSNTSYVSQVCPMFRPQNHHFLLKSARCFWQGVFHVECKYTSRGARLIEVNCRMGGGPVHATNKLVWGVDLVEENLLTCAGIPSAPYTPPQPLKFISEYSINAEKTGRLQHTNFLQVPPQSCVQNLHRWSYA